MAGLWEGVPASPCSAASDDHLSINQRTASGLQNTSMYPKRSIREDPSPNDAHPWKRTRIHDTSDNHSTTGSGSVEFVEATSTIHSDFVARLNNSANEERRQALLLRLAAIKSKKKNLNQQSPKPTEPSDDDVILVEVKSTLAHRLTSPSDVKAGPSAPSPPNQSKMRTTRLTPPKKAAKAKLCTPSSHGGVIIVDDDTSTNSSTPNSTLKTSRAKKSIATKKIANTVPLRTSNRIRRPRALDINPCETSGETSPFIAPVNELWPPEAIPRYFEMIKTPMDLRTVKRNLETSIYISPLRDGVLPYQFDVDRYRDDMQLIFTNAMIYNKVGDMLYNSAKNLMDDFNRTMQEELPALPSAEEVARTLSTKKGSGRRSRNGKSRISAQSSENSERSGSFSLSDVPNIVNVASSTTRTPRRKAPRSQKAKKDDSETSELIPGTLEEMSERLTYLRNSRTAVLARTSLPQGSGYLSRAALLYNIAISLSQKRRCAAAISEGKVPSERMEVLLDMVKSAVTPGDDDDFELDYDKLDNVTWRNLEAFLAQFVPGFKTIRHSTLGREFTSVQQVDEEVELIQNKMKKLAAETNADDGDIETRQPKKNKSFFDGDVVDDDSSSDSGSDSEDSDTSDSGSDEE